MPEMPTSEIDHSRRTVLRGAAIAAAVSLPLLAPAAAEAKRKPPKGKKPKGKLVGSAKDVPVGSGKYFAKDTLLVTQPKKGKFVGLNATCTHANCPVSNFEAKGKIQCNCHNQEFTLDGKPIKGPARRPLNPEKITVVGGKIYKG